MSKHTQGKWKVHPVRNYVLNSNKPDNYVVRCWDDTQDTIAIARMVTFSDGKRDMDEVEANANLIASAPEMLKMLYEIESVLHTAFLKDESSDIKEVWKKVLRLIYKAEGGAK